MYDPRRFKRHLSRSEKGLKNAGLKGESKPDPCNAGAVVHTTAGCAVHRCSLARAENCDDHTPQSADLTDEFHVLTSYIYRSISIMCGVIMDPHNNQLSVGLIAQLVEYRRGQGSSPRSGLDFPGLSLCCLGSTENCKDLTFVFED